MKGSFFPLNSSKVPICDPYFSSYTWVPFVSDYSFLPLFFSPFILTAGLISLKSTQSTRTVALSLAASPPELGAQRRWHADSSGRAGSSGRRGLEQQQRRSGPRGAAEP
jgi:hypothetical protein